ncbi:hypothetical protein [Geomicrobium sp. JCM 19055]|uniref:hypothetical protein n=1 Tax=Geomicrobium sp. JCM 19055 TaxID=1460649 RepID=UPI0009DF5A85|nr:hypothetical protein [Geomicrobium sp. JCM 19055]
MHVLDYDGYLLDLDGTVYRGNEVIPEAVTFINWLIKEQKKFLFVTNNSSKTPKQAVDKLNSMSIPAKREHIFTSALMAAYHVQQLADRPKSAYIIGSTGLKVALEEVGIIEQDVDPDVVIVGIDRTFTYDKLEKASLAIQEGAKLIATNGDKMIPTERGSCQETARLLLQLKLQAEHKQKLLANRTQDSLSKLCLYFIRPLVVR